MFRKERFFDPARTAPRDRAYLAMALAAVWPSLGPAAAAHAKRAAADLEDAFRDSIAPPIKIYSLGMPLAEVYNHLDPVERRGRANAVADLLAAALRKPKKGPIATSKISEALATTCAHLDRPGAVRIPDVLLAVLDSSHVRQFPFLSYEKTFKKIAARLDERDLQRLLDHPLAVGRVQRVLLDSLARSKNRSFRNTWDYLDATESNGTGTGGLSPGTNW